MNAVLLMLLILLVGGCAPPDKKADPASPQKKDIAQFQGYQRFVSLSGGTRERAMLDFALDTKTGQLCRTWPWEKSSVNAEPMPPQSPEPPAKTAADFLAHLEKKRASNVASAGMNGLPLCFKLYTEYPDTSSKTSFDSEGSKIGQTDDPECVPGKITTADQLWKCIQAERLRTGDYNR